MCSSRNRYPLSQVEMEVTKLEMLRMAQAALNRWVWPMIQLVM